jgi:hypothetical protein
MRKQASSATANAIMMALAVGFWTITGLLAGPLFASLFIVCCLVAIALLVEWALRRVSRAFH